jgi:hypothetical protein
MKRDALDAEATTTLLEFGCPISGTQVPQIGKKRTAEGSVRKTVSTGSPKWSSAVWPVFWRW